MSDVIFDRITDGRHIAYVPLSDRPANAAFRGRVRQVGAIERHADKWFWFMRDDSDAGMCSSLVAAKGAIASRL